MLYHASVFLGRHVWEHLQAIHVQAVAHLPAALLALFLSRLEARPDAVAVQEL